jgi:PAS domain S-box-containing protein
MNLNENNPLSLTQHKLLQACIDLKTTDTKTLAKHLHRSQATVRNQFQEIFGLLNVHGRYTALKTAEDNGWFTPNRRLADIGPTDAKLHHNIVTRIFSQFNADNYHDHWYQYSHQQVGEQVYAPSSLHPTGISYHTPVDCLYIKTDEINPLLYIKVTDIIERRQAETRLRHNENLFSTLIEQAATGMIVLDEQLRLQHINTLATQIFAAMRSWIGRNFSKIFSLLCGTKVGGQITDIFRHALITGERYIATEVFLLRQKQGIEKAYNWEIQRLVLPNGQPGVACYLTDITEKKQAEENLHIAAAAIETQNGIIVTDAHRVIIRVNQAFSRITGYSAEESIGQTPVFLRSGLHNEDFYECMWASVVTTGYWQGELWSKHKNGKIYLSWHTITAITGGDGTINHFVGSFTDISVQKQVLKTLLDARQPLDNHLTTPQEQLNNAKPAEITEAINVFIKTIEADKSNAKILLSKEIEATVLPFVNILKAASSNRIQSTCLIDVIENNLQQLVNDYGNATSLPTAYQQLTPIESQVASLVRQGLSTKSIAATLNSSPETINIHRKHIRKKLGLNNKASNLQSFLQSLSE